MPSRTPPKLPKPLDASPVGPDALRKARQAEEPVLHLSLNGDVAKAWGDVEAWFGIEPVGKAVASLCDEASGAELQVCVLGGMVGVEELQPMLLDGRRVTLGAWPCSGGWLVAFHDVTAMQVLAEAKAHRDRMEAVAGLAGAVSRELNDPMAIVQGRLELLLALGGETDEALLKHVSVALDHARRISATLRNLRVVSQRSEETHLRVALVDVVDDALSFLGPRGSRVVVDIEPNDLCVGGDPAMFTRVVSHLLRLSIEGVARGPVALKARRQGGEVVLTIDVGRHGRAEPLEGVDLTIDETLLRSVGGRLEATRVAGTPAFAVHVPLAPAVRGRARPLTESMLVVGSKGFAYTVQSLLEKDGFHFDVATDAYGALALAQSNEHGAVVSELLLPGGLSGLALGKELALVRPSLVGRVIVVTDGVVERLPEPLLCLPRPLSRARLLDAIGRRVRRA